MSVFRFWKYCFTIFIGIFKIIDGCSGCGNGNGVCGGSSKNNAGYELIPNKVYACRGAFNSGMYSTSAMNLCNMGYEICDNIHDLDGLGFQWFACNSIFHSNEFYASMF